MKNRKPLIALFLGLVALLGLFSSCGNEKSDRKAQISKELGLDVSAGEILDEFEDSGWFGDGITFLALKFPDGAVGEAIRADGRWRSLPFTQTVTALVHGLSGEEEVGPYLTDGEGKTLIPDVRNGFYLLIDRFPGGAVETDAAGTSSDGEEKPEADPFAGLLAAPALNFTLGVWDAKEGILYFCRMDT